MRIRQKELRRIRKRHAEACRKREKDEALIRVQNPEKYRAQEEARKKHEQREREQRERERRQNELPYSAPAPKETVHETDADDEGETEDLEDFLLRPVGKDETESYDLLLYLLSAYGAGSKHKVNQLVNAIWAKNPGVVGSFAPKVSHVLRRLRLLGHVETDSDGKRWSVAPTVLARVCFDAPDNRQQYVLCGARDVGLLEALRGLRGLSFEQTTQPQKNSPSRVVLRTESEEKLRTALRDANLINTVYVAGVPVAEKLIDVLPQYAVWYNRLALAAGAVTVGYARTVKITPHGPRDVILCDSPGFYEFYDAENVSKQFLLRGSDAKWRSGPWYDLRYAAFRADRKNQEPLPLLDGDTLFLREADRLPGIFERVLVLSGGLLPEETVSSTGIKGLVYTGVSPELRDSLNEKLKEQNELA